jgi:hypothetical protein
LPQPPQLDGSERVSTQEELQVVVPRPQRRLHLPDVHTWSSGHTFPQPPQLFPSESNATHPPLHLAYPALQVKSHFRSLQTGAPFVTPGQTLPQAPQFEMSFLSDKHDDPQAV